MCQKLRKWLIAALIIISSLVLSIFIIHQHPESTALIKLFYYMILSNVYISVFPHEPVLIYYGKFYNVFMVSSIAGLATLAAGTIDYETILPLLHHNKIRKLYVDKKIYKKSVYYFSKYPFWTIAIAVSLPIPFYPFKFLSFASLYNKYYYLGALLLGRIPRYLLLTKFGDVLNIPDRIILIAFIIMFLIGLWQILRIWINKEPKESRKNQG